MRKLSQGQFFDASVATQILEKLNIPMDVRRIQRIFDINEIYFVNLIDFFKALTMKFYNPFNLNPTLWLQLHLNNIKTK